MCKRILTASKTPIIDVKSYPSQGVMTTGQPKVNEGAIKNSCCTTKKSDLD